MPRRDMQQQQERLLSISPMSDAESHWVPPGIVSSTQPATESLSSCFHALTHVIPSVDAADVPSSGNGEDFELNSRLISLCSSSAAPLFGIILDAESDDRDDGCEGVSSRPLISWGTATMVAKHVYLHDVVFSLASSVIFHPSLVSHGKTLRVERRPLFPATVWEKLLCAALFHTPVDESVSFRSAMSWKERFQVEETVSMVRQWTQVLTEGFFYWVPSSTGVRLLLLLRETNGNSNGFGGDLDVVLLGLDDIRLVQQHWAMLRRHWLISENVASEALNGSHVQESLDHTVRVFEMHCRRMLRRCMDDNDNDDVSVDGDTSGSRIQLARVVAVVAHIEAYLQVTFPSPDERAAHSASLADGASSCLPFTATQRDHLIRMLTFLFPRHDGDTREKGRSAAARWVRTQLGAEEHTTLLRGPLRLLFHEFLASLAHWLVLQIVPVLLHRVNLVASRELKRHPMFCGDWSAHGDAESNDCGTMPPFLHSICRSLRLQFQRVDAGVENMADSLHSKGAAIAMLVSSPSEATSQNNLLSSVTMSNWVRWLWNEKRREKHRCAGEDRCINSGSEMHYLSFFPSLTSRGVRLMSIFNTLKLFGLAAGEGATAELTDRFFEACGTSCVAVNRWVVGCNSAEVTALFQQQRCKIVPRAKLHVPLELFTLGSFILRYRPVVDAARVVHVTSRSCQEETVAEGKGKLSAWCPLPPLFRISLTNFDLFLPTNQVKLICSAVGVEYTAYASGTEEEDWKQQCAESGDGDAAFIGDERAMTKAVGRAAPIVLMEDSGLVKVYDCVVLQQLEDGRRCGLKHLRESGTLILQAFLRARWSVRWNFVPLRRRSERRAVVILQAVLRARRGVLTMVQRLQRQLMQRYQWLEGRRRSAVARESLVRMLELHVEPREVGTDDCYSNKSKGNDLPCVFLIPETRAAVASPFIQSSDSCCSSGFPDERQKLLPVVPVLHHSRSTNERGGDVSCGPHADISFHAKTESDVDHRNSSLLTTLLTMEEKGRGVVRRVEAKGRRELLVFIEAEMRKRLLLGEYRKRRLIALESGEERAQALLQESRRLRWKPTQKRQMRKKSIHSCSRVARKKEEAHRAPISSVPARDTQGDCMSRETTRMIESEVGDILVVIDMGEEEEEEEKKRALSLWSKRHFPGKSLSSPRTGKRISKVHSEAKTACAEKPVSEASPNHSLKVLGRKEYEDRTFIGLSEQYTRNVMQRLHLLESHSVAEMVHRRFIFLVGVLERQEMLTRWHTIIVPYCVVTETLHGDLLVAMVVLQDVGPQRQKRAASKLLRDRQVNHPPDGVASACAQRSIPSSQHLGNKKTKCLTPSLGISTKQRNFLMKPSFNLLSSRSTDSRPVHGDGAVAAAETELVVSRVTRKDKTPSRVRKHLVTWADSS